MPEHMPAARVRSWCLENYEPPLARDPWDEPARVVADLEARNPARVPDENRPLEQ